MSANIGSPFEIPTLYGHQNQKPWCQQFVPNFSFSLELAQEILKVLKPIPDEESAQEPIVEPKNLPIDRNFLRLLESLRPTPITAARPDGVLTEEQLKEYNAFRMREYRKKSSESVERTKILRDALMMQLRSNAIRLKEILKSTKVEEEVKTMVAEKLGLESVEKVMEIPEFQRTVQKYWRRKKTASESHNEQKSLFYWSRAAQLHSKYGNFKSDRSPSEHNKKVKDALMKANAYDHFMDDKRVNKVIKEFEKAERKFRKEIEEWLHSNSPESTKLLK